MLLNNLFINLFSVLEKIVKCYILMIKKMATYDRKTL